MGWPTHTPRAHVIATPRGEALNVSMLRSLAAPHPHPLPASGARESSGGEMDKDELQRCPAVPLVDVRTVDGLDRRRQRVGLVEGDRTERRAVAGELQAQMLAAHALLRRNFEPVVEHGYRKPLA